MVWVATVSADVIRVATPPLTGWTPRVVPVVVSTKVTRLLSGTVSGEEATVAVRVTAWP